MNSPQTHPDNERVCTLAKDLLGEALRNMSEAEGNPTVDTKAVAQNIADTLAVLFEVTEPPSEGFTPPSLARAAHKALVHLQLAFGELQKGGTDSIPILCATATIAKVLAALFPVSKADTKPPSRPAPQAPVTQDASLVEQRTAPRAIIETEVGFQSETNFFAGFLKDVSTGGLFIATYDVREIGSEIYVNFTLPNGMLVSAEGIVRWVREYNELIEDCEPGIGVQFQNLDEQAAQAIDDFINQREPIFFDDEPETPISDSKSAE